MPAVARRARITQRPRERRAPAVGILFFVPEPGGAKEKSADITVVTSEEVILRRQIFNSPIYRRMQTADLKRAGDYLQNSYIYPYWIVRDGSGSVLLMAQRWALGKVTEKPPSRTRRRRMWAA
jgi:hypothetical protein